MSEYTYADVIIDPEDPRVEIGKEYYFGDTPREALNKANGNKTSLILDSIYNGESNYRPFYFGRNALDFCSCVIRKKTPEKKYVPFDLSKEEDRAKLRGAWVRFKDDQAYERQVFAIDKERVYFWSNYDYLTPEGLLRDCTFLDGSPCGVLVEEV